MTYPTEHLMDLLALAHATADRDELLRLLRDGHQLYHQGLAETQAAVTAEHQDAPEATLLQLCRIQQLFLPADATRADALSSLTIARWEHTPTALAYESLAEHAAANGISLLPEEGS